MEVTPGVGGEEEDEGSSRIVPKTEVAEEEEEEEDRVAPSGEAEMSFPSVQKCVFCSSSLTLAEGSKLLECLHALCANCLSVWAEEAAVSDQGVDPSLRECPVCLLPSRRTCLVENKFLAEVGEGAAAGGGGDEGHAPLCSCDDRRPASDWCETCKDYICQECTVAHKQLTCTKDHVIRPKEEGGVRKKEVGDAEKYPCPNHPKEFLLLYCTSCDVMTCRDCQLVYHREHKYKFVEEIANDTKAEMRALVDEVVYKVNIVNSGIGVLDERTKKITEKKSDIVREIKEYVRKTSELVTRTGKDLLNAVNQACSTKLQNHEAHRESLVVVSRQATHCTEFANRALATGSDNCLLYSKQQILGHLNRMKAKKSQIPNPDVPIAINLVKSNLELLEMMLQSFMALQVDNQLLPANTKHKQLQNFLQHLSQRALHVQGKSAAQAPAAPQQQQQQSGHHYVQQPPPPPLKLQHPAASVVKQKPPPPQQLQQPPQQQLQQPHPSGVSPSIQGLQKLQYQQTRQSQQFHHQGSVQGNPLRQQQVTSSTHPQPRPVIMYQQKQGQQAAAAAAAQSQQAAAAQQHQHQAAAHYMQGAGAEQQARYILYGHGQRAIQEARKQQLQQLHMQQQHLQQQQQQAAQAVYPLYQRPNVTLSRSSSHGRSTGQTAPHVGAAQGHPTMVPQAGSSNRSSPHASITWHIPQTEPVPPGCAASPSPTSSELHSLPPQVSLLPVHHQQQQQQQQHHHQHHHQQPPPPPPAPAPPQHRLGGDSSYKIVLKSLTPTPSVSSSVPKTPSPLASTSAKTPDDIEASLSDVLVSFENFDKTVEAAAGGVKPSSGSTAEVHSSTRTPPAKDDAPQPTQGEHDDPNDDWCAVCMDGGDLVCCDNCPKVFHTNCHIPTIVTLPEESWQCLLCQNISQIACVTKKRSRAGKGLTDDEQKVLERILLELYCQYDISLHFRAPVPPENVEYFKKVDNPMSFDQIRARLSRSAAPAARYETLHAAVRDIRQVFRNAFNYYEIGTKEYVDGMQLEEFLEILLTTYLPQFAHSDYDRESDSSGDDGVVPVKKIRRVID